MIDHNNPYEDPACKILAEYLRDRLNEEFPGTTIVQSVRSYDAVNVPYSDFPVLKVYRLSDEGRISQNTIECSAVISYSLVLPDQDKLAPILRWVRKKIRMFLSARSIDCAGEFPILKDSFRAEYRNAINEQTLKVHAFLRISIQFTDN